jgi:hypothetical protein
VAVVSLAISKIWVAIIAVFVGITLIDALLQQWLTVLPNFSLVDTIMFAYYLLWDWGLAGFEFLRLLTYGSFDLSAIFDVLTCTIVYSIGNFVNLVIDMLLSPFTVIGSIAYSVLPPTQWILEIPLIGVRFDIPNLGLYILSDFMEESLNLGVRFGGGFSILGNVFETGATWRGAGRLSLTIFVDIAIGVWSTEPPLTLTVNFVDFLRDTIASIVSNTPTPSEMFDQLVERSYTTNLLVFYYEVT